MGRANSRQRQGAHRVPDVGDGMRSEGDPVPPNVMWPARGSGFEADPFSPAGAAQVRWRLIDGLSRKRGTRWLVWLMLALFIVPIVIGVINIVRLGLR